MKKGLNPKKRKTPAILKIVFAILLLLLTNCAATEFKIHSVKLERKEANNLYFRLITDIDFLDKRECKGHRCFIRFEFYPVEKGNPKRKVFIGNALLRKEFFLDESGVKRQFELARNRSGPTFSIYKSNYSEEEIGEEEMITSLGSKSDKEFEYLFKIPFERGDTGDSWEDPSLNDERVAEYYYLKEGTTYTFWGRIIGPTFPFTFAKAYRIFPYFFLGIRSQLYRWEVTIPK
ncbi:hypothetical protein EHQ12_01840 [Leptospira gomenensis]|uniref:Uncharacterized protein n=1 Tax=Leptospira gomenensis TaxID=2484974 RepID=A0A5F1YFU8_9LEPT|nr:hypothetical protein [Leptospira gomenensis]TGK39342.1 hypothetical protein EHQ17_00035 [Leptospira gomenensis]TGK44098.1 hypothetical protein EHQ07_12480 [Leptospira gomenensis]TGK44283.1 hypothetical protein EHQ12_01840 [Leptospira gomenensis]TGK65872.1 hypothetical protein EHQ13_04585 [Leptospira gomenensis]